MKTNFYKDLDVKLKENKAYDCFSWIDLDSINECINEDNNYVWYPQVYLEECQYRKKKIKKNRFLNKVFKSDSSDNEANNEPDSEPDTDFDDDNESEKSSKESGKSSKKSDNNEFENPSEKSDNRKSKKTFKKFD